MRMPNDGDQSSPTRSQCCVRMSVYFVASWALLVLAAVAFFISVVSTNWSASGQQLKMGIWDFCIHPRKNSTWSCYPANTGKYHTYTPIIDTSSRICQSQQFLLHLELIPTATTKPDMSSYRR